MDLYHGVAIFSRDLYFKSGFLDTKLKYAEILIMEKFANFEEQILLILK